MNSTAREEAENEDQNESLQELREDENHRNPHALHRIQPKAIPAANHDSFLSVRKLKQLPKDHDFIVQLEKAYYDDYKQIAVLGLGNSKVQWCQKVAFTPRSVCHKTLSMVSILLT